MDQSKRVVFNVREGELRALQESFFSWDSVIGKNEYVFDFELDHQAEDYSFVLEEVRSFIERHNLNYTLHIKKRPQFIRAVVGERVAEDILQVS